LSSCPWQNSVHYQLTSAYISCRQCNKTDNALYPVHTSNNVEATLSNATFTELIQHSAKAYTHVHSSH